MPNNKSPGNDRIRIEFYEAFCDDLKTPLLSVNKAFKVGELKVQSCKLCNSKYMIASTKTTNTDGFAFTAVLVLRILSCKVLFIKRKGNRSCLKVGYFLR